MVTQPINKSAVSQVTPRFLNKIMCAVPILRAAY